QSVTDATRQAFAGFGYSLAAADFDGDGIPDPLVGAPFENVDLVAADGDIETHLQIGQIELKQLKKNNEKNYETNTTLASSLLRPLRNLPDIDVRQPSKR
ncbi:MAG: FG-GAP repeat protein, partial [Candidatus Udaeobacter sp.]